MDKIAFKKIRRKIFFIFPLTFFILAGILMLSAGTLNYWQGWTFIFTLFVPFIFVASYFLKYDPQLLVRRMQFREKLHRQKLIIKVTTLIFFVGFLIPGLDYRFAWSNVPTYLVIISDLIIFMGYLLVFFVFKENSFASRIIEIQKDQKVISTGPYSIVRHPMYVGQILIFLFMPTALGSYWALIFFIPIIPMMILRILHEEEVLIKGLEGYKVYTKKVKYRLIPGIW